MVSAPEISNPELESQETWGGADSVMDDLDEKRVLFQALDSF